MRVVRFSDLIELIPYASDWDRLAAGNPFRTWTWISTWWRHYGDQDRGRRLFTLGVKDDSGRLAAIVPWYVERSRLRGRILRFLGSGNVCSEYLGVLADPEQAERAADALAEWLADAGATTDRWDQAEMTAVDAQDRATGFLVEAVRRRNLMVHSRRGPNCWRVELPPTWPEYLAMVSHSRRKKLLRAENQWIKTGRARLHVVQTTEDLGPAQDILIDLHRRRRESLGGSRCFVPGPGLAFHLDVMGPLLAQGRLLLYWIDIDGTPVAAEYMFRGGDVVYGYQAGVAPETLHLGPGHLGKLFAIRRAIDEGCRAFDFLRGDEPYKLHWRAAPRATLEFRVAAPRRTARARLQLWSASVQTRQRLKSILRPASPSSQPDAQAEDRGRAATLVRDADFDREEMEPRDGAAPRPADLMTPSY